MSHYREAVQRISWPLIIPSRFSSSLHHHIVLIFSDARETRHTSGFITGSRYRVTAFPLDYPDTGKGHKVQVSITAAGASENTASCIVLSGANDIFSLVSDGLIAYFIQIPGQAISFCGILWQNWCSWLIDALLSRHTRRYWHTNSRTNWKMLSKSKGFRPG